MNEPIKHKWLPSEPTIVMLEVEQFASSLAYESHEVQAVEVYKAMWEAVPEREPLSDSELLVLLKNIDSETNRLPTGFKLFAKAIEKAHGIGETKCT